MCAPWPGRKTQGTTQGARRTSFHVKQTRVVIFGLQDNYKVSLVLNFSTANR